MIIVNDQFILHFIVSFIALIRSTSGEDLSEYGVTPGVRRTSCPCGRLNKNQAKIVGGDEVEKNEFPFMVGIRTLHSPFVFCGGTIISAYHVLTAAHCTEPKRSEKLAVTVGDHNIYDSQETQAAAVLSVKEIIEHEQYDKRGNLENDIALMVTEKIGFNPFVEPACMQKEKINLEGQSVKVIGWGKLSPKGPYSEVLHKVNLKVVPLAVCDNYFIGINIGNPNQLCTRANKADSCQGDSGGPVLWRDPQTNRYVLAGIVSFGDHCGKEDAPAVNTDVYFHRDWIEQKMAVTRSKAVTCSKI